MTYRRTLLTATVLLLTLHVHTRPLGAATDVSHIKVPDGFVVERVAAPPLVEHPMMADFDDRGRLLVGESAGVNHDFKKLQENPPGKILLLEDTDRDGTFDKRTVFADRLTFPSGVLWHGGAVYACSPPGLWRFEDTDGDGVADKREQIVTGFGSTGNAADLHGPYLGPEGWLYFCDGRNGHDLTLGDGTKWTGKAACVYRCRTDGSGLEVVFGGGFDNPVEVAFTPAGEPLVNVNLFTASPHRVDAIVYGIEGGNYPYENAWRELKRTGDFLPSVGDLGWVATSGFMRYRGDALGKPYVGRYFSTEFNTRRVRFHFVERDGAGFRASHEEFLACDDRDFHPTDVLEDPADGSLLVIDTGGWFRIGCPQSQTAKPDVKGAIYRIRRKDATRAPHPAEPPLAPVEQRIADTRLAALRGDAGAASTFVARLTDESVVVRREAATGLGRLRSATAVGHLLDAAATTGSDRFLDHAIIFALIRIGDRSQTAATGLGHTSPAARRAALIALDQMNGGGGLTANLVVPHLASEHPPLRDAALAIATAHPQWADHMVPTIRAALLGNDFDAKSAPALRVAVAAFVHAAPVQSLAGELLAAETTSGAARRLLLRAIAESGIARMPEPLQEPVRAALGRPDDGTVLDAIEVVRATLSDAFDADLLRLARDERRPGELRVAALAAALPRMKSTEAGDFRLLLAELAADRAPLERRAAAQAIAAAPLDNAQLTELNALLGNVGSLELPVLLPAYERSSSAIVGSGFVHALLSLKSLPGVTPAALTRTLAKYPPEVGQAAVPLLNKLNPDAAAQKTRMTELEPLLAGGDPSRGQSVFFGKAAACATCHTVRGTGAHVGPDLSKVGAIRAGRDLLESVVFPSASFARGYESFVVQTKANQLHAGTLAAETADAIVLRTPTEVRIPRASVKTIRQDRLSIMPQGLDAQLSPEELRDLLAFLQSLK